MCDKRFKILQEKAEFKWLNISTSTGGSAVLLVSKDSSVKKNVRVSFMPTGIVITAYDRNEKDPLETNRTTLTLN